jgi:hypothetical protein
MLHHNVRAATPEQIEIREKDLFVILTQKKAEPWAPLHFSA